MIDFSGYTKQAIEADMLAQVDPTIDTREGSMVQTAVGACAYALEGFYLELDKVQKSAYSQTAQGESLDLVAKTHSTIRIPATPTVRQGTFLDDNGDPVTIPVGSRFKTINGEDSVVFVSGDLISAGVYELTCETPGIIGNSYTGAILPITAINGLATATIGTIITVGADEETDEALRVRYDNGFKTIASNGNVMSYHNICTQIPGVGAIQVHPTTFVVVPNIQASISILVLDSNYEQPSAELVAEVQNVLAPQGSEFGTGLAPIGAVLHINGATPYNVDVSATVTWDTGRGGADDVQAVKDAIANYFKETTRDNWGVPTLGTWVTYDFYIYRSRVTAIILDVDGVVNVTDVEFMGHPVDIRFDSGNPTYNKYPALGTVTLS